MKLSALFDEVTSDWQLNAGLDAIEQLKLKWVELRGVDGVWAQDLDAEQFHAVIQRIKARGLATSALASKLGRAAVDKGGFDTERDRAERVFGLAAEAGIPYVRVMGFGRGGADESAWRRGTINAVGQLIDLAERIGVRLILENHPSRNQWTGTPAGCLDLMQELRDTPLRLLFDPANFITAGEDPVAAWQQLREYVGYVHIKDVDTAGNYCLPGDGVCGIRTLLADAVRLPGMAFASLEPHLLHSPQTPHYSGDQFLDAGRLLISIVETSRQSVGASQPREQGHKDHSCANGPSEG